MQNRKDFWAKSWINGPKQSALTIDRPYCKAFQLMPDDLKRINDQVFTILYYSLPEDMQGELSSPENQDGIFGWLSTTKHFSVDVLNQMDRFMELEQLVLASFEGANFLKDISGIQLPIDIRVVHPVPPPKYLETRKAVDYLHTDAWRGEPPDIVNCVLYCVVNEDTSQLVVYDIPQNEINTFETYTGTEKDAVVLVKGLGLDLVQLNHEPGETIFYDGYSPHFTKRNGSKVRISLNFSFRRNDPYSTIDERWERQYQPWSKYWYLPAKRISTFEERCEHELEMLTERNLAEGIKRRQIDIERKVSWKQPEERYAGSAIIN